MSFGHTAVVTPNFAPHERSSVDAAIVGGGFYGCEVALELKRLGFGRILILEREPGMLRRASYVNQARVHNGYHYPRALVTALRSRMNFDRFIEDYGFAIDKNLGVHINTFEVNGDNLAL